MIGHEDFAPYVLDGQTSKADGEDDWYDVITVEDGADGEKVTKFAMDPEGTITHRALS
ncbi:hypothetical protein [Pseudoclavibacter soli]|uniref:hypothetical protein n=1 Tax=Pseudoclavibacter soli TaxID=452623 RepID=UPI0004070075|nr:hypothetical protein [Pseudoclavibacter soli]